MKRIALSVLCVLTVLTGCAQIGKNINGGSTEGNSVHSYSLVSGKVFHILIDEYFDTDNPAYDPKMTEINRVYKVYDGDVHKVYEVTDSISVSNEYQTILEARKYLNENAPELLMLRPLTIVSPKVLSQWQRDGYEAENEYWSDSPSDLTFSEINK